MLRADKRNCSMEIHPGAMTLVGLPMGTWQTQGSFNNVQFHLSMGGYLIKAAAVGYQFQLALQLQYLQNPSNHMGQEGADGQKSRWKSADTPLFSPGISVPLLPFGVGVSSVCCNYH